MNIQNYDKPLFSLTVGEFLELQKNTSTDKPAEAPLNTNEFVYGYEGGAKLFNCSKPTFFRILKSGRIDSAVTQVGRKIVINKNKALELLKKPQGGRK